jgi:hypothetical protein
MTVLYNSADNQIRYLYMSGCSAAEISNMENLRTIASDRLDRLESENNRLIHNKICTCK